MEPMKNISILLDDMRKKSWHITAFQFDYNNHQYIVLFEDISNLKIDAKDCIVFLTFIDRNDDNHILQIRANTKKFDIHAQEFREYFGIQYADNLGDIFSQFYKNFDRFVPQQCLQEFDEPMRNAVVNRLSRNDNENINNIYCYAARRNGKHNGVQYHRTPFNSDKTRLLRENLYKMLGDDNTISFCYRDFEPLSDAEICARFAQKK